jgi:exodeoxyribonuclease VII small subunit
VADLPAQPSSPQAPVEGRYEEIVTRLSKVVERLEGGGLSLEESIAAFEEGVRLARAGSQKLDEAEKKVELLLENDRTQPFASGPAEGEAKRR